jgi:hypothetical protein
MPIANDIWVEQLRPDEGPSLVASFRLADISGYETAGRGAPFTTEITGFGVVLFSFVCCIKGIYSASLSNPESDQGPTPERAELLC